MNLEERLEAGLPTAWRPDKDDMDILIGEVVDIQIGTSDYGQYPIVVVRTQDGTEKAVHGFHSVLQSELQKHRPNVGERVGIKFLGDVPTKPGSPYKSYKGYRIQVERDGTAFNWDALGDTPEPDVGGRVIYDQVAQQQASTPATVTVPEGAGSDDIPFF